MQTGLSPLSVEPTPALDRQVHLALSPEFGELTRRTLPAFPGSRAGYHFDEDLQAEAGWLVYCDPRCPALETRIPRDRRVLVINEPSPLNYLPTPFLNQFGILISPFTVPGYRGTWFPSHPAIGWFFGSTRQSGRFQPTWTYQELVELPEPEKQHKISVIVSNKVIHRGHRRRLRFLEVLQQRLGDRLVVYGRGINEIRDKADAILPYRYHLTLENTIEPSYWTEKLADAYLGYALPIYSGCPDINRWFDPESMVAIDLNNPNQTADRLIQAIADDVYSQRRHAIHQARERVLQQETLFDVIARAITATPQNHSQPLSRRESIQPLPRKGIIRRLRRELYRTYCRAAFACSLN